MKPLRYIAFFFIMIIVMIIVLIMDLLGVDTPKEFKHKNEEL